MIEKIKEYFLYVIEKENNNDDFIFQDFMDHVPEVEKWALRLGKEKGGDLDIILAAVWLHDIGQTKKEHPDHAIASEEMAKEFLEKEGLEKEKINAICHAVRSHRNSDIPPESLEAKILAVADSASHMTSAVYIFVSQKWGSERALGKLERDYRDLQIFPELKIELTPLYESWKNLLQIWPDNIDK